MDKKIGYRVIVKYTRRKDVYSDRKIIIHCACRHPYHWCIAFVLLLSHTIAQTKFEKVVDFYTTNKLGQKYYTFTLSEKNFNITSGFGSLSDIGPTDIFIIKSDSLGNIIKKKRITRNYIAMGYRYSISFNPIFKIQSNEYLLSGDGYAYANTGYIARHDLYIINIDSNLSIKWMNSIAPDSNAVAINFLRYVFPTYNKEFIALCNLQYYDTNLVDVCIIKIDSLHKIVWSKKIHKYPNIPTTIIKGIITQDSNYLLCCVTSYTTTNGYGYIPSALCIKMDKNGNTIFNKEFKINDTTHGIEPVDIIELSNGDLIIPIRIYSTNFYEKTKSGLIKIDKTGNIIFSKAIVLNPDTVPILFKNILYETDDMIIGYLQAFLSSSSVMNGIKDIWIKLNKDGVISSIKLHNSFYNELHVYRNFISKSFYSGYFTGGIYIHDMLPLASSRLLLKKIDPFGNTCSSLDLQHNTNNFDITIDTGIVVKNAKSSILSWTPTIIEAGTDSTLCFCYIPGTFSTSPANCYTNGSASFTPSYTYNYSYSWSSPISSNSATAANIPPGNYTLTISDSTGCSRTIPFTISANFSLPLSITGNSTICSGQTTTLTLHGAQALTWNTGQTDSSIIVQPFSTTTYSAVAIAGSCTDTIYYTVNVLTSPTINLSASAYTINIGDTALVQASGATYYSWSPAFGVLSPNSPTTLITPTASTQYCIIGKDSTQSCTDTACLQLTVEGNCFDFKIPNIFTPNNDNINDTWHISFPCPQLISHFHLSIYDRWGVHLFQADKPNAQWDGRTGSGEPVPTGTYFFTAEFKLNNKKQKLKGYITLLR